MRPASDLADRMIQRRAVEAVIWGMPAVNYDLMLQEMLDQDQRQGECDPLLVAAGRLEEPDADAEPGLDLPHGLLQHEGRGPGGDRGPAGGQHRLACRQHRQCLADAARGCRPAGRGQGQGRQVRDPAAGLQGPAAVRIHRAAIRHLRRLRAVALQSREPQRRGCRQVGGLWPAHQGLPVLAGVAAAADRVHRCDGRALRLHHPLRPYVLRRTSTASCRASPGWRATAR